MTSQPVPCYSAPRELVLKALYDAVQNVAPKRIIAHDTQGQLYKIEARSSYAVVKIADGPLAYFTGLRPAKWTDLAATLDRTEKRAFWEMMKGLEEDPRSALAAMGKETGVCCICSRQLTDPESVAAGIGPICAAKAFK